MILRIFKFFLILNLVYIRVSAQDSTESNLPNRDPAAISELARQTSGSYKAKKERAQALRLAIDAEIDNYIYITDVLVDKIRQGQIEESDNIDDYYDRAFRRAFVLDKKLGGDIGEEEALRVLKIVNHDIALNLEGIIERARNFLGFKTNKYSIEFNKIAVVIILTRNLNGQQLYLDGRDISSVPVMEIENYKATRTSIDLITKPSDPVARMSLIPGDYHFWVSGEKFPKSNKRSKFQSIDNKNRKVYLDIDKY